MKRCDNSGCFVMMFVMFLQSMCLIIPIMFCGFLFDYSLMCILGKDVPWYIDILGGIVCNALIIPIAFICWILETLGYVIPFI